MRHRGQGLVQTLGLLFVTLMVGAFAVDAGIYFTLQNGMQNAADAAALAGASELFKSPATSLSTRLERSRQAAMEISQYNMGNKLQASDIEFGFYNVKDHSYTDMPYTQTADSSIFKVTGGYNAVRVTVRAGKNRANKAIPSFFARFLGVNSLASQANAIAMYAGGVDRADHVRPLFLCQAAWDEAAKRYGDASVPQITLYGNTGGNGASDDEDIATRFSRNTRVQIGSESMDTSSLCPPLGEGNWGIADFSNSKKAVPVPVVNDWLTHGYQHAVSVGKNYRVLPGGKSGSYRDALDSLANNRSIVPVPLYGTTAENGTRMVVTSIAGFQIDSTSTSGSTPHIRGHFVKILCHSDCELPPVPTTSGGMSKIRLVR